MAALVDKTGCSEFQPIVLMPLCGAKPEAPCGLMMSQRALAIADVVHSPAGSSLTELCDGFVSPSSRGSAALRDRSRSRARSLRSLSAETRSPRAFVLTHRGKPSQEKAGAAAAAFEQSPSVAGLGTEEGEQMDEGSMGEEVAGASEAEAVGERQPEQYDDSQLLPSEP